MNKIEISAIGLLALVVLALGMFLGSTLFPRVQTKEVQTEVIKRDVVTVTKEVINKDGSKEVTTTVVDHSKETDSKVTTVVPPVVKKTTVAILAGVQTSDLTRPNYGISVQHEVIGNVTAGLWGLNNGTVGISIGVNF